MHIISNKTGMFKHIYSSNYYNVVGFWVVHKVAQKVELVVSYQI